MTQAIEDHFSKRLVDLVSFHRAAFAYPDHEWTGELRTMLEQCSPGQRQRVRIGYRRPNEPLLADTDAQIPELANVTRAEALVYLESHRAEIATRHAGLLVAAVNALVPEDQRAELLATPALLSWCGWGLSFPERSAHLLPLLVASYMPLRSAAECFCVPSLFPDATRIAAIRWAGGQLGTERDVVERLVQDLGTSAKEGELARHWHQVLPIFLARQALGQRPWKPRGEQVAWLH